jgi:hypothetical protein
MTPVERHAELVYAESLFEKVYQSPVPLPAPKANVLQALLGIVYSGDWLAFIKEACVPQNLILVFYSLSELFYLTRLNMRTIITIYRNLQKYLATIDAEWVAANPNSPLKEDPSVDAHFRSGVYLGAGMSTLILSLLPGKLLTIIEMFGYHGERKEALDLLCKAGGWTKESHEPSIGTGS